MNKMLKIITFHTIICLIILVIMLSLSMWEGYSVNKLIQKLSNPDFNLINAIKTNIPLLRFYITALVPLLAGIYLVYSKYFYWKHKLLYSILVLIIGAIIFPFFMMIIASIIESPYRGLLGLEILIINLIALIINGIIICINLKKSIKKQYSHSCPTP